MSVSDQDVKTWGSILPQPLFCPRTPPSPTPPVGGLRTEANVANRTLFCDTSFTETARKLQFELAKLGRLKQVNLTHRMTDTMVKRSREDSPPVDATDSPSSFTSSAEPCTPSAIAAVDASRTTKYLQVPHEVAEDRSRAVMRCSLAPHSETLSFGTFEEFEVHYAQVHTNRCSECHKNFPTQHFLGLHISENHDPLVEARKAREEKTYRCFVEDCDKVCSTPQKRKMHLQAKHFFPKDYDFFIVNDGIDKRSSMLRTRHRRASSAASRALYRAQKTGGDNKRPSSSSKKTGQKAGAKSSDDVQTPLDQISPEKRDFPNPASEPPSQEMDELTSTMSALKFVPQSVRFGRGKGRAAGFARH
ncbi:MAG: hypothetical protein Q9173_001091 [Seirophora scorigena]